jgi:hypothetical protein
MANLVECAECGHSVSTEAYICPNCQKNPRSSICAICSKIMKRSESDPICQSYTVHTTCMQSHLSRNCDTSEFLCPTCSNILKYKDVKYHYHIDNYSFENKACPNCGQPLGFDLCKLCNMPVASHCKFEVNYSSSEGRYSNEVCHKSCGYIIKENQRKNRCKNGLSERCGIKLELGFLEKFFGYTVCKRCR